MKISLSSLLTLEQIKALEKGQLNLDEITVRIPEKSPKDKNKETLSAALSWLDSISEGKSPNDSVPEFWLVLELISRINRMEDTILDEDLNYFLGLIEEDFKVTKETLEAIFYTPQIHLSLLKKMCSSPLVTATRQRKQTNPTSITALEPFA